MALLCRLFETPVCCKKKMIAIGASYSQYSTLWVVFQFRHCKATCAQGNDGEGGRN